MFASAPTAFPLRGFIVHHDMGEHGMLYSIDLIAAGGLVVDYTLPAIMLFFALALAIVFID
ncbi:MAG: hypothetical protein CVU31_01110 [Betaproteobacteria bacterium HGW-Betaproteobacteria-4]|nr:MAG: hypothetical protein CVU31_01110 [Betaproteobacteria bacterium HGW-Betaproteobacteria-4]